VPVTSQMTSGPLTESAKTRTPPSWELMMVGVGTQPSGLTPLHTVEFWRVSVNCPCPGGRPASRKATRSVAGWLRDLAKL